MDCGPRLARGVVVTPNTAISGIHHADRNHCDDVPRMHGRIKILPLVIFRLSGIVQPHKTRMHGLTGILLMEYRQFILCITGFPWCCLSSLKPAFLLVPDPSINHPASFSAHHARFGQEGEVRYLSIGAAISRPVFHLGLRSYYGFLSG